MKIILNEEFILTTFAILLLWVSFQNLTNNESKSLIAETMKKTASLG